MAEKPTEPKPQLPELPTSQRKAVAPEPATAEPVVETPWRVINHQELAKRYADTDHTCLGPMAFDAMQQHGPKETTVEARCTKCGGKIAMRFSDQITLAGFFLGFFEQPQAKKKGGRR